MIRTRSTAASSMPAAALVACALGILVGGRVAAAARPTPAPGAPGPTLAVEDTMHTDVSEVLVRAPRVTLNEILDRVARGEARRDSLLRDLSFVADIRVVHNVVGKGTPELFAESISKVYKKKP